MRDALLAEMLFGIFVAGARDVCKGTKGGYGNQSESDGARMVLPRLGRVGPSEVAVVVGGCVGSKAVKACDTDSLCRQCAS